MDFRSGGEPGSAGVDGVASPSTDGVVSVASSSSSRRSSR